MRPLQNSMSLLQAAAKSGFRNCTLPLLRRVYEELDAPHTQAPQRKPKSVRDYVHALHKIAWPEASEAEVELAQNIREKPELNLPKNAEGVCKSLRDLTFLADELDDDQYAQVMQTYTDSVKRREAEHEEIRQKVVAKATAAVQNRASQAAGIITGHAEAVRIHPFEAHELRQPFHQKIKVELRANSGSLFSVGLVVASS